MEVIETNVLKISEIEIYDPNQWIILGNPVFDGMDVLEGVVIAHNTDKRCKSNFIEKSQLANVGKQFR